MTALPTVTNKAMIPKIKKEEVGTITIEVSAAMISSKTVLISVTISKQLNANSTNLRRDAPTELIAPSLTAQPS